MAGCDMNARQHTRVRANSLHQTHHKDSTGTYRKFLPHSGASDAPDTLLDINQQLEQK